MVSPETGLELRLGGAWTDATEDLYNRDPVTITRGRADEGGRVDHGRCSFTINNRSGKYSPRNPHGDYFGLIGRNTPVRITAAGATPHLRVDGGSARVASTSALDITADLDVRVDVSLDNWAAPPGRFTSLIGRWDFSVPLASYRMMLANNLFVLVQWAETAIGSSIPSATSTLPIVIPASNRLALRATVDVNNGASGRTIRFYTAATMAGPWVQLGDPVVQPTVTTIANGAAPLEVGRTTSMNASNAVVSEGRVHAAQVRDGINGTAVADVDFTAQAPGATSFVDAAGRTWTTVGAAKLTDRHIRFAGEVPSWPQRWDTSGRDVYVPIEAAGIMRRLGQGARALDSTLRRQLPALGPVAYWPMEDEASATRAASPIAGVAPMTATGMLWAQADSLPSSAPLPVIGSSDGRLVEIRGQVPAPATPTTAWSVRFVYRHDTVNSTQRSLIRVATSGTVRTWTLDMSGTLWTLTGVDASGVDVIAQDIGTGPDLYKQWILVEIFARQSGSDVIWDLFWTDVGGGAGAFGATLAAASVGFPASVGSPLGGYHEDLDGLALGHVSVWSTPLGTEDAYAGAIDSWAGEVTGQRARRLTLEEAVPLTIYGDRDASEPMGPQGRTTLLELLGECADTEQGILHELRDTVGLALRLRDTLYNQDPALTLSYALDGEVAPPLEPEDDDQQTRNDVTVTRAGGSSGRVVREDGPLSVLPPPDGVGLYAESVTRSLDQDAQAEQHAAWLVHLGTVDEPRYPVVHVRLHAAPHLIDAACAVDSGARLVITDLPDWLPPGDADLMAQGYQEILTLTTWDLYFNCTPGSPWLPAVADSALPSHFDTAGSVLAAAADAVQTSVLVATTTGPVWTTDPAHMPWDITVGGEVMTVTGVAEFVDTYARTVAAGGWGSSSSGQAWTVIGGSGSAFSVGSSTGLVGLAALSTRHIATLADTTCPDTDAEVTLVAPTVTVTGDGVTAGLALRVQGAADHYHARLQWQVGGAVVLVLSRTVAGTRTNLTTVTVGSYTSGQTWRIRARIQGSTIQARAWPTSGRDPVRWQAEATDTAITAAGPLGLLAYLQPSNTNALPLSVGYRSLAVITPQTMTVARSVNDISKPHASGSDLRLADTPFTAL
ncbi:hypothetical protein OG216_26015 [Streptomycetaceae bacterium NBC_01309]